MAPQLPQTVSASLKQGVVIPAHPLALTDDLSLDERHQKALTRYYLDAGAGGLAVGVHTTEFAIHEPHVGLYRPVLELAVETARARGDLPIMVAGIVGDTPRAVAEAGIARELGYHIGMISMGALRDASEKRLLDHARRVSEIIPIMGFYLQPSVGGRVLSETFWRGLAEIPNLTAIKIAPFNRYCTLEVARAVAQAGRAADVALYTGNDDAIVGDLLTEYEFLFPGRAERVAIVGGLLGHWAYWTARAVEHLDRCRRARADGSVPGDLLTLGAQVTESNEAVFDPDNAFRGCIAGILYVLSRSGLVAGVHPLGEHERLSPGQREKIDRIIALYPHLMDHAWIQENLSRWLAD